MTHEEEFKQFWAIYPNKKSKGDARKKFVRAVGRILKLDKKANPYKIIIEGCKRYKEYAKGVEKKYIKHPNTWLNQDCWEDEIEEVEEIKNPHPKLDMYCDEINRMYKKSQRSKGNWEAPEVTEGKELIDNWLKTSKFNGFQMFKMIEMGIGAMQKGTEVSNFAHWEKHLK